MKEEEATIKRERCVVTKRIERAMVGHNYEQVNGLKKRTTLEPMFQGWAYGEATLEFERVYERPQNEQGRIYWDRWKLVNDRGNLQLTKDCRSDLQKHIKELRKQGYKPYGKEVEPVTTTEVLSVRYE